MCVNKANTMIKIKESTMTGHICQTNVTISFLLIILIRQQNAQLFSRPFELSEKIFLKKFVNSVKSWVFKLFLATPKLVLKNLETVKKSFNPLDQQCPTKILHSPHLWRINMSNRQMFQNITKK